MKILKTQLSDIKETKEVEGLVKGEFKYVLKEVDCSPSWIGPYIDQEAWEEVLAFFKWTYDTMQSESQVRGYVNAKENKWGFWAFKQKARTGMTATELGEKETPEEAIYRCKHWDSVPSDDWRYAMTVHHHCGGTAFQSSTDEANEKDQFGLHITVGSLNSKHFDLHSRFTFGKCSFQPDLSQFWDIGDARRILPPKIWHDCAAWQMGHPPGAKVKFPNQWKANVIEEKVTQTTWTPGGGTSYYGGYSSKSLQERALIAMERIAQSFASRNLPNDPESMWEFFEDWAADFGMAAWRIMRDQQVDPEDMAKWALPQYELAWNQVTEGEDAGEAPKQLEDDKQKALDEAKAKHHVQTHEHSMSDEEWTRRAYGCE